MESGKGETSLGGFRTTHKNDPSENEINGSKHSPDDRSSFEAPYFTDTGLFWVIYNGVCVVTGAWYICNRNQRVCGASSFMPKPGTPIQHPFQK